MSRTIPARFVELPGRILAICYDRKRYLMRSKNSAGVRHSLEPDTVLATVLFTNSRRREYVAQMARMVGKSTTAYAHVTKEIEWFRGREIDMVGDRPLAIFDGPARAIRCASAICEYASRLGIEMRTGLHTGECEMVDGKVGGVAAQIGVCVADEAQPGEVLVSSTVKDLVAGSGIVFEDRGVHPLNGCGEWRVYAVQRSCKAMSERLSFVGSQEAGDR